MDRYEMFRRDVPTAYLRDCLLGLFEDYLAAAEYCSDHFELTEAVNVLPYHRRGLIEGRLRETALRYKQIKCICEPDDSGFWNHTLVFAGDCMMTQSTARHPNELVKSSYTRLAYAEPDNQKCFEFKPATESRSGFIYGILIHGRDPKEKFFPSFANVVFPKPKLTDYFLQRIDLFSEFPEVVRQCTTGIFEERHTNLERQFETIEIPEPELRDDFGEAIG